MASNKHNWLVYILMALCLYVLILAGCEQPDSDLVPHRSLQMAQDTYQTRIDELEAENAELRLRLNEPPYVTTTVTIREEVEREEE